MTIYRATIEYTQKAKHDEQAMLEAEHVAFAQAIPHLRGKEFKKLTVKTIVARCPDHFDLSVAKCTVEMVEV